MKSIRIATPADAEQILSIYAPYILNTTTSFELEVPSITEFGNRIKKYVSEAPWLVCVKGEEIVGYAYASPHRGRAAYQWNQEVSVYIKEAFHRQRIAHILYDRLFQLLQLQGYTNALAGIVAPNPASEGFHLSMGFSKVGTYKNIGYKFGAWHDVTWYEKFLQSQDQLPTTLLSMDQLKTLDTYQKIMEFKW